jgi:transketolase
MTASPSPSANQPLDPASWNIQTSMARLKAFTMSAELEDIAAHRSDVVVLTADLASSNGLDAFAARFPDRFVNTGIAEQNMMSIAAGIAASGLVPFVATFASFASLLCAEHLRTDMAYPGLPVRILAHHAGISMGFYGTSHHAVEDIALTRAIGNLTVVSAADGMSIRALIRQTIDLDGPVYLRIGRGAEKPVYDEVPGFTPGKLHCLRDGGDVTLIATGIGVRAALDAAEFLDAEGTSAAVYDAAWLKPFDEQTVVDAAKDTGAIVTVEEHNPHGGLGTAVADALASAGLGCRFAKVALPDDYALVAPPTHLYRHYGLTGEGVAARVREVLG